MSDYADTIVEVDGQPMRIRDIPDAFLRAMLGCGHFPYDLARRSIIHVNGRNWPYAPEVCRVANYDSRGEWITPEVLVCPGCGMDFT